MGTEEDKDIAIDMPACTGTVRCTAEREKEQ